MDKESANKLISQQVEMIKNSLRFIHDVAQEAGIKVDMLEVLAWTAAIDDENTWITSGISCSTDMYYDACESLEYKDDF